MPKITSIDALIGRVKEAYPDWNKPLIEIRECMEKGYYAAVYDIINVRNYGRYSRIDSTIFSSERILEILDDDGNIVQDKFDELIEAARCDIDKITQTRRLLPLREQLQDDFNESYEFNWVSEF